MHIVQYYNSSPTAPVHSDDRWQTTVSICWIGDHHWVTAEAPAMQRWLWAESHDLVNVVSEQATSYISATALQTPNLSR